MTLAIVTATVDLVRALECVKSWREHATHPLSLYIVGQGAGNCDWEAIAPKDEKGMMYGMQHREILGVVPAFNLGVQRALHDGADIIACFHDDLLIEQDRWDETVISLFKACPRAGLAGFGGAKGLGADDLYKTPYNPMQLARQGFRSNMRDAEAHGVRSEMAEPVACLDGFSQIGKREFWEGFTERTMRTGEGHQMLLNGEETNLFAVMEAWGVVHHFYDGMLGAFAKRLGYMTWYLPVACHHFGGRTAVADTRYHLWADTKAQEEAGAVLSERQTGDQFFWTQAHQIGYDQFRDVLPIHV